MEKERETNLVKLCVEAACVSKESVEIWRRQRRSLERLPPHLACALLQHLLSCRLLFPSLLEVFKYSVEEIDLRGENSVDAEWMAYLGAFRYLRYLNISDCYRITSSALWSIAGISNLREIDISRCSKVTDAGIRHLVSITTLEKLWLSETGITEDGVALVSSLKNLSLLDLGGLPVTDSALHALQVLTRLEYLDVWGSKVTNKGAAVIQKFPDLSFLNLAWTSVTNVPNVSSLELLNLSNCTINSIFEGEGDRAHLGRLVLSGVTFVNEAEAFSNIETNFVSFLDVSNSSLHRFCFLPHMKLLKHLDLSSSSFGDDSAELIACIGENLRNLNLSKTRVSSYGVGILAGHVPNLEVFSLSHTSVDDVALSYIGMMLSLKIIDLSNTNIKGFVQQSTAELHYVSSLTALQNLCFLEKLNLEQTQVRDADISPLSKCKELNHLSLRCASLTDMTLHHLSSLSKLISLSVCEAVLTNHGLDLFSPPETLRKLDLRGCWLLTEDAISLFFRKHPHIELRHELAQIFTSVQNNPNRPSPSRPFSKTSQMNKKKEKMLTPQAIIDQRLKYSREELLVLQYSPLSLKPPQSSSTFMPNAYID